VVAEVVVAEAEVEVAEVAEAEVEVAEVAASTRCSWGT